jgi:hypothetical protein
MFVHTIGCRVRTAVGRYSYPLFFDLIHDGAGLNIVRASRVLVVLTHISMAGRDQVPHAQLAHVAELHRLCHMAGLFW